jgi:uracil phosphoribosyltransferase
MQNVYELKNAVVKHIVSKLRSLDTKADDFRDYLKQLSKILLSEALKNENLIDKEINTWKGKGKFPFLEEDNTVPVAILRAGLPMLEGILEIFKASSAGFLAIKRDEKTLKSDVYYVRLPEIKGKTVIITDPMVATGGSLENAIEIIKKENPENIISLNVIAAPEGLKRISSKHPDVKIYVAQIDEGLNDEGYIIPGIGDAGDRAFNT